jgi:hypothetical protein
MDILCMINLMCVFVSAFVAMMCYLEGHHKSAMFNLAACFVNVIAVAVFLRLGISYV